MVKFIKYFIQIVILFFRHETNFLKNYRPYIRRGCIPLIRRFSIRVFTFSVQDTQLLENIDIFGNKKNYWKKIEILGQT